MDAVIKWVGLIASIIAIIGAIFNLFAGWPFNRLLSIWEHQIVKISSSDDYRIEALKTSSGRVLNPPDKFSYKFHLPLKARGVTRLEDSANIWVVLQDEYGGYYLQNPPVQIKNGEWSSYNIRPLHGIKRILWLRVDAEGHSLFLRKVDRGEWGKFKVLPSHSTEVSYIDLR